MASVTDPKAVRAALISDIQELAAQTDETITRNYYRENGKYSERLWSKYFAQFKDFRAAAGLDVEEASEPESNEFKGDAWTITLPKTRIHTLDQLLEYAKVDLTQWQVDSFIVNKWEVGAKNADKKLVVEPLFQVKATLRKRAVIIAIQDEIAALKEVAKKFSPTPKHVYNRAQLNGNILEINLPDLHLGKLSWSRETGYGNYDTKIAVDTFRRALNTLLDRVSHFAFERILFIIGNDLLHSDDLEGRTTSGTYVNTDGRYHKTFVTARDMMIEAIERLRTIAPVTVISCPGNHDQKAAWHLADSLECYFHKYKDVEIHNEPTPRKFYEFGKVMLMFCHGHEGKRTDYALQMAADEPEMWGRTKYREVHTGHLHQTQTQEFHGVRVRIISSLCETDAWHSQKGFTNNLRTGEVFVWNKDEGLVAQAFYGAD